MMKQLIKMERIVEMKLLKVCLAIICMLGLLAGCNDQSSSNSSQKLPPNSNSENSSSKSRNNSEELGPGADVEQTMPDVVK